MQWDEVSTRLTKQCYTRGTQSLKIVTERAHSGLMTDNSSCLRGKIKFPGDRTLVLLRSWPPVRSKDKELSYFCPFFRVSEKPWVHTALYILPLCRAAWKNLQEERFIFVYSVRGFSCIPGIMVRQKDVVEQGHWACGSQEGEWSEEGPKSSYTL